MSLVVTLPLRTISELNARDGWRARARRMKEHRTVARMAVMPRLGEIGPFGPSEVKAWRLTAAMQLRVTLTRIGPRLLDDDNLRGALKGIRDGVADALGVKDNDPRVVWGYWERRPTCGDALSLGWLRAYGVRIEIASPVAP